MALPRDLGGPQDILVTVDLHLARRGTKVTEDHPQDLGSLSGKDPLLARRRLPHRHGRQRLHRPTGEVLVRIVIKVYQENPSTVMKELEPEEVQRQREIQAIGRRAKGTGALLERGEAGGR